MSDLETGIWIAGFVNQKQRATNAESSAETRGNTIDTLVDIIGSTNDKLAIVKSERDSYRRLSTEMVKELKGLAPTRLSAADADDARKQFLGSEYQKSLAQHEKEMVDSYKQSWPSRMSDLVNNTRRKKNGGKLR